MENKHTDTGMCTKCVHEVKVLRHLES